MKRTILSICVIAAFAGNALAAELKDLGIHGFVDLRAGTRVSDDPVQDDMSLAEIRAQLQYEYAGDLATVTLKSDFLYDDIPGEDSLDIEKGTGWIDLREANLLLSPSDIIDVKVGRQVLTWGRGDLLFINDMFPKDWQSFFSGRDEEYLKAPSDALFVSFFPAFADIDVAYMPRFDADRFISGDRISFWNPMTASLSGRSDLVNPLRRDDWFTDHEISLRVSKRLKGYETELYGYYGFWKNPEGFDQETMKSYFPELSVYGASVRGGMGKGLLSLEAGYYDSREDRNGSDPMVPNDEIRFLCGYEREIVRDFSAGVQYYLEWMQDYGAYNRSLPDGSNAADEDRHVLTLRLTKRAMNQNLTTSLFVYYSPSDSDVYLRPSVSYKATDNLLITGGANLFYGDEGDTFFAQFEKNNNVYAGVRQSF